jgi:predicted PurR-regulated permease PerM
VIGLTIAAFVVAMLIYFSSIIGTLHLAFILVYLLHPVAAYFNNHTRLSWRASVNIIYLFLIIILITTFTITGLAAVNQIQSLITVIERFVSDLPELLNQLSGQVILIGPFRLDFSQITDLGQLGQQVISTLQLLIGRAGAIVGTLATATASMVGWSLFILVISYFVLADTGKVPNILDYINIPGYAYDIQKMSSVLGRVWNVFLRGQLMIVIMVIISYTILLTALGVKYSFAIAIRLVWRDLCPISDQRSHTLS